MPSQTPQPLLTCIVFNHFWFPFSFPFHFFFLFFFFLFNPFASSNVPPTIPNTADPAFFNTKPNCVSDEFGKFRHLPASESKLQRPNEPLQWNRRAPAPPRSIMHFILPLASLSIPVQVEFHLPLPPHQLPTLLNFTLSNSPPFHHPPFPLLSSHYCHPEGHFPSHWPHQGQYYNAAPLWGIYHLRNICHTGSIGASTTMQHRFEVSAHFVAGATRWTHYSTTNASTTMQSHGALSSFTTM